MPFTPSHLGPGAAIKAIAGRHFSFMVFGGSQVLMDIEPLMAIIQNQPVLHGYTHTVIGALLIGLIAGVIGRPISVFALNLLRIEHPPFTWIASFSGAFIGTLSHVALDAVMHSDMNPLWPWAQGNGLLGVLSVNVLHIFCLALGFIGAFVLARKFL